MGGLVGVVVVVVVVVVVATAFSSSTGEGGGAIPPPLLLLLLFFPPNRAGSANRSFSFCTAVKLTNLSRIRSRMFPKEAPVSGSL